jgi:hypothetical protein
MTPSKAAIQAGQREIWLTRWEAFRLETGKPDSTFEPCAIPIRAHETETPVHASRLRQELGGRLRHLNLVPRHVLGGAESHRPARC